MLCRMLTYADVAFMRKALDTQSIADITLCYAVLKGVLQWIFGWLGDRYGRRYLVCVCVCACACAWCVRVCASSVGVCVCTTMRP